MSYQYLKLKLLTSTQLWIKLLLLVNAASSNSLVQRPWSDPWLFSHTSAYLSKQSQFYLEDTSKMKITSYLYYFNPVSSNNHSPCFPPESPIICSQHSTQNNLLKLKILPLTFNSPMTSHLLLLFSHSLMSDSLRPHGLQPNRLPCPALSPGVCSNSLSIESVMTSNHLILCAPFSSCPQSFLGSGSFPMSQFFTSGGRSIELQLQHQSFQWILRSISFRIDWFDLLVVRRTLKSLLQHQNLNASLHHSAFFMVQLSHPHKTMEKP